MRWAAAVMLPVAAAAGLSSSQDLRRAKQPRPAEGSPLLHDTAEGAFEGMAEALRGAGVATRRCADWSLAALDRLQDGLIEQRDPVLDLLYEARNDRRKLHFEPTSDYKQRIREQERTLAPSSPRYNATRDGKCAESVMWWAHHIPHPARKQLAARADFHLPEPPVAVAHGDVGREYHQQIQCTSCHVRISSDPDPPAPTNIEDTCNTSTWYEGMAAPARRKRADWDYTPAPRMCEGIGGIIWGDGEGQITFPPCTPVMNASDIPAGNVTSTIWPESFTVQEQDVFINQQEADKHTSGRFPGADPCAAHIFENVTYKFFYDGTTATGPRSKCDGVVASSGNKLLRIWQEPTGNMYIENYKSSIIPFSCICVAVRDAVRSDLHQGPIIGALKHDFCKDCVLVGRERIGVEFPEMHEVVADHWNKGPHHFWVDVATNRMVRGWQPYNGLNVWYNWTDGAPVEDDFALTDGCKSTSKIIDPNVGNCTAPHPPKRE